MDGHKFVKAGKGYRTEIAVSWESGATVLGTGVEMRFPAGSLSGTVEVRKYPHSDGGERWGAFLVGEMSEDLPIKADRGRHNTRDMAVRALVQALTHRAKSDTSVKYDPAAAELDRLKGEETARREALAAGKNCARESIADRRPLSRGEMGECGTCGAVVRILAGGSLSPHRPGQSFGPALKAWRESDAPTLPVVVEESAPVAAPVVAEPVAVAPEAVGADKAAPVVRTVSAAEVLRAKFGIGAKGEASKAADKARTAPAPAAPVAAKFPAALDALATAPADRDAADRAARLAAAAQRAESSRAKDAKRIGHDLIVPCTTVVEKTVMRGRGSKKRPVTLREVKKVSARLDPGVYPRPGTETADGSKGICPECGALVPVHSSGKLSGHKVGGINPASVSPLPQRAIAAVDSRGADARASEPARGAENAAHALAGDVLPLDVDRVARMGADAAALAVALHSRAVKAREIPEGRTEPVSVSAALRSKINKLQRRIDTKDFDTETAAEAARLRVARLWAEYRAAVAAESGERNPNASVDVERMARSIPDGPALLPNIGRSQGGYTWAPNAAAVTPDDQKYAGGQDGFKTAAEVRAMSKSAARRYWRDVKANRDNRQAAKRIERESAPVRVVPGAVRGKKQHGESAQTLPAGSALSAETLRAMKAGKEPIGTRRDGSPLLHTRLGARREGSALTHYGITVRDAESADESRAAAGIAESGIAAL